MLRERCILLCMCPRAFPLACSFTCTLLACVAGVGPLWACGLSAVWCVGVFVPRRALHVCARLETVVCGCVAVAVCGWRWTSVAVLVRNAVPVQAPLD